VSDRIDLKTEGKVFWSRTGAETEVHDSIDLQSKGKVILMQSGGDRTPRQVLQTAQVLQ
jgi:hypothetical protein